VTAEKNLLQKVWSKEKKSVSIRALEEGKRKITSYCYKKRPLIVGTVQSSMVLSSLGRGKSLPPHDEKKTAPVVEHVGKKRGKGGTTSLKGEFSLVRLGKYLGGGEFPHLETFCREEEGCAIPPRAECVSSFRGGERVSHNGRKLFIPGQKGEKREVIPNNPNLNCK